MSTIKKIAIFALAAVMILAVCLLAACGDDGGTDDHVHTLQHVEAVDATEEADGNIEYWYCTGCGKYFSDSEGKNEISASSIVTTVGGGNEEEAGDVIDSTKTVKSISIYQNPDKTYYEVGDEFTVEGGILLVTYTDGTEQYLPMTSSSVTYTAPGMDATGSRTVTISCGGKTTRLSITVSAKTYDVVFNLNYEGAPDPTSVKYVKGETVVAIEASREGYTLYGWYKNADFTEQYVFGEGASEDLDLYALWLTEGGTSVTVTFDYDYYGDAIVEYSYPMDSGTAVRKPSDPTRVGYAFSKWVDGSGQDFDFATAVAADTTVTAQWTKTATGSNTWVFEAEDTDLTGKTGSAYSGTATEAGMIVKREGQNCSNDRAVTYLYDFGDSLEFYIASDEDAVDVTLEISLSQEMIDYTYTSSDFAISLNGTSLDYTAISFTDVPAASITSECLDFQWFTIGINLTLKKGANTVQVMTTNTSAIPGTTITATAPMVDAIRFTTSAVVIWDANYGLPVTTNY